MVEQSFLHYFQTLVVDWHGAYALLLWICSFVLNLGFIYIKEIIFIVFLHINWSIFSYPMRCFIVYSYYHTLMYLIVQIFYVESIPFSWGTKLLCLLFYNPLIYILLLIYFFNTYFVIRLVWVIWCWLLPLTAKLIGNWEYFEVDYFINSWATRVGWFMIFIEIIVVSGYLVVVSSLVGNQLSVCFQ